MEGEIRFGCEINKKILEDWKNTINHNQKIKERLEEMMMEDTKRYKEALIKKLNGK